jgi:hypothetical protein
MKPIAKGALWAAVLAIAACIALPIGFVAQKWSTEPPCPLSEPLPGVDDFSRLGRNQVSRVVAVRGDADAAERQICELVRRAAGKGEHIAIVGARQTYPDIVLRSADPRVPESLARRAFCPGFTQYF